MILGGAVGVLLWRMPLDGICHYMEQKNQGCDTEYEYEQGRGSKKEPLNFLETGGNKRASIEGEKIDTKNLEKILQTAIVIIEDSNVMSIYGEMKEVPGQLFYEDDILYIPVQGIAEYLGASMTVIEEVLYIGYQNVFSGIADGYNIALTGTTAALLEGNVLVRDEIYYLPARDFQTIFHIPIYYSAVQKVLVIGTSEMTEEEIVEIRKKWKLPEETERIPEEFCNCCRRQGLDENEWLSALNGGRIYYSNQNGMIGKWKITVDGNLSWNLIELNQRFLPDTIYCSGVESNKRTLFLAGKEQKKVGLIPELLQEEELRIEMGEKIEKKAISDLKIGKEELPLPKVEESISLWENLKNEARPGDVLLFHNPLAAARYGYFNHAALILEKTQTGIRLLQARGSEDGVGSDKEIDLLDYEDFYKDGYWDGNETVILYRCDEIDETILEKMVRDASEYYQGYKFGYGGERGEKETNCAELVADTYDRAGVSLLEKDSGSRLRMLLKGETRNLIVLPDDLALSERLRAIAYWRLSQGDGN